MSTYMCIYTYNHVCMCIYTYGEVMVTSPLLAGEWEVLERLRENLADFVRNISRIQENLYQDVTCDLSI